MPRGEHCCRGWNVHYVRLRLTRGAEHRSTHSGGHSGGAGPSDVREKSRDLQRAAAPHAHRVKRDHAAMFRTQLASPCGIAPLL